jgi:hypothetical protein
MKKKGGILAVKIQDQTYLMDDFENKKQYRQVITLQLDTETSRKFYQQEKEKLLNNGSIQFIKINDE